jgi:hypothetical protein
LRDAKEAGSSPAQHAGTLGEYQWRFAILRIDHLSAVNRSDTGNMANKKSNNDSDSFCTFVDIAILMSTFLERTYAGV